MTESSYWVRWNRRHVGRRAVLRAGAVGALGAGALALVGCGDDDDSPDSTPGGSSTTPPEATDPRFGRLKSKVGDRIAIQEDTWFKPASPKSGGTINWSSQYQAATVYPNNALSGDHNLCDQIHQPLYSAIETGAIMLHAVDRVEEVDNLTWTVHVRDNLKFHPLPPVNGRPATGEDVKFSWENAIADKTAYWGRQNGWIDKIEAMPGNMVKFTSKVPNSGRIGEGGQLTIMAREAVSAFGQDINKKAIGTGPWMLPGEYAPDRVTELQRHPDFMIKGRPFADKMTFRAITDQQAHISAFVSGQIDYMSRDLPEQLANANKGSDGSVTKQAFIAPEMIWFNQGKEPFNNPNLRKAASLAIDRNELIKKLVFDDGRVNGPIPWGLDTWALPEKEVVDFYKPGQYEANLAEAKKLVEAAGGSSLPELVIINQNDIAIPKDMGPLVASMLEKAGFKTKLTPGATLEWITNLYKPDNWHLSINQWGNALDPFFYLSMYTGPAITVGNNNRSFGGGDPEVDAAVNALLLEFESESRPEKVREAQRKIMTKYHAALNLFDGSGHYLTKNHLKDFRAGDTESTYLQWDYWFDKA